MLGEKVTEKTEPNPIDVYVGQRLRLRRTLMGMSQEKLGSALGLTFQQVQKYERGVSRIVASRLYEVAELLNVQVEFFFEGFSYDRFNSSSGEAGRANEKVFVPLPEGQLNNSGLAEPPSSGLFVQDKKSDILNNKETVELIRAYYRISNREVRKKALQLLKALAVSPEKDEP